MIEISIICPVYNEENYIENCIESILEQDFTRNKLELILVDGFSTDATRSIIEKFQQKHSFIKLLDNPHKTVPYALNIAIEVARGEYIARIDAHATFPKNYLSTLYSYSKKLNADNVGCLIETLPANNSLPAISVAYALSSSFGVGNSFFRIGTKDVKKVDTVPFGFFKKDIFERIGCFDIELTRNQDDEFNGRIIKNNGSIYLIPDITINYYARDSLFKTGNMLYQYGLFKPLVNKKLGAPATIRQFFPLVFVTGLFLGVLLSFVHPVFMYIYLATLLLYLGLAWSFSFKAYNKFKRIGLFCFLPLTYFIIHFQYGYGYMIGIKNLIISKPQNLEINR